MLAATCELPLDQGGTWNPVVTMYATNLTGYSARFVVKAKQGDTSALLDLDSDSGAVTVTPGTDSTIQPVVTAAQAAALPAGRLVYDLTITQGTTTYRVLTGVLVVRPRVAT